MSLQRGLHWESTIWGFKPEWTIEPQLGTISEIVRQTLNLDKPLEVEFLKQGILNKIYTARHGDSNLIIRVSLPVEPMWKTLSEVVTIEFVSRHSDLPVPTVRCFSSNSSNPVGFEWIIMNRMPGVTMEEQWRSMRWPAKEAIVKQVALYTASMFRKKFREIGNLYPDMKNIKSTGFIQYLQEPSQFSGKQRSVSQALRDWTLDLLYPGAKEASPPKIDRIVSAELFLGGRVFQDVSKGPFRSSHDFLSARLILNENEKTKTFQESDDSDDRDDAEEILQIIRRLKALLPKFFPPEETGEQTILFHDDLSWTNILVDENGVLTGVVDWECVCTFPLWKACEFPAFLIEKPRDERPDADAYKKRDPDGKLNKFYWARLLEYELTQLRSLFLTEMQRLEPDWFEIYISSRAKRDFDIAVGLCDDPICIRTICEWLDTIEKGEEEWDLAAQLIQ